jgi:hypothetical protein
VSTALDLPALTSLRDEQRALKAQLGRLQRRLWLELGLEFVAEAIALLVVVGAILVFLDWWLRLERPARVALLVAALAAVLVVLVRRARRLGQAAGLDGLSLAVVLDRFRPGTGQHVADVLQLPELIGPGAPTVSQPLVQLAVQRASAALAQSDWRRLWNRGRTAGYAGLFVLALLLPAVFVSLAPEAARLSAARWLLGSTERWPQRTYLTVSGLNDRGRLLAPRDEPLAVEVRADLPRLVPWSGRWIIPDRGAPLVVRHKPAAPAAPGSVQIRERTAEGIDRAGTMLAISPVKFRYELAAAPASSTLDLTGGDDWLGPIAVERVDRPALADLSLRVKEPGASADTIGFRAVADPRQHLLFLPDTEVELTLTGNQQISGTQLKVNPGVPPALKRRDDRTFTARWTLREATTLEIVLTSRATGLDSRPAFLSMGILRDREPRVTIRALGISSHVTPAATVPLSISATDDFGLGALRLRVERSIMATNEEEDDQGVPKAQEKTPSDFAPTVQKANIDLPLPVAPDRPVLDQQVRHDLVLDADPPPLGTLIRIVGEADDRCVRGVQTGRSSVLALQVVSADELFYEVLIRQRAERAKFVALLESHEKQTPLLDRPEPPSAEDWVRLARLEHATARQLDQIAGRLADTLQEMKLNQVGSPKSHRLLQEEIIEPIRALGSGSLNSLRNEVQSLASSGQSSATSRESVRRLHGEVVTTMKAILAQMSQWESFVDVVNQVAEVIRLEQKVLQETEKARDSRTREVFDGKP